MRRLHELLELLLVDGRTSWKFLSVRAHATRDRGNGLFACRAFAAGDVCLTDHWLLGIPMQATRNACELCLRVCSWSPVDTSCPGCVARYCSIACRDAAWQQHHCLLCTAVAPKVASPFEARVKAVVFSLTLKVELPFDSKFKFPALDP